ncbi:MAG TPA: hypothetical protein PKD83_13735 [Ignavibacteria bacterium]|nr:hypothetical protein [Ignavibacteria bacterium]
MKYSDDIFQLIKSLSKQEKIYFRKFAATYTEEESSNYLKYFDEIVNQISKNVDYDESKIRSIKFTGKFLKNLSYHKNYLYNMILDSVTFYNREKKSYISLSNQISQINYLMEKSLYEQAGKLLTKAKRSAYKSDSFPDLLKILNLEKKILKAVLNLGDFIIKNKLITEEQENVTGFIQNNIDFSKLYGRIDSLTQRNGTGYARGEDIALDFENINNSPLMQDESNAKSFLSKFMFMNIKLNYHLSKNEIKEANKYAEEVVQLLEENPGKGENYLHRYIISLNNLLNTQCRISNFEESEKTVLKMKELEIKYSPVISLNEKIFIYYSVSVLMISKYLQTADFEKMKLFLEDVILDIDKYEFRIILQQRIILYYYIGLSYFVLSDFESCIKWLGKILNSEKSLMSEDYQCLSRIVFLLSYYELKYFDSLEYVLKSTYHFLIKRKRVFKYENIILKYLRRSFRVKTESELYEMFREMKYELKKISEDPFERNADTFNILYWLDSKLKKITLTEVLLIAKKEN